MTNAIKNSANGSVAKYIAMIVTILMAIGTVFVFSAGVSLSQGINFKELYHSPSLKGIVSLLAELLKYPGFKQIVFLSISVVLMLIISRINYHIFNFSRGWFLSPLTYLFIISIALLVAVLIPGIGREINYARRWLMIPAGPIQISFQPSEFAKWVMIFFVAAFCDKYKDSIRLFWKRFVPICIIAGIVTGLILLEDFGTAALVALVTFLLLILSGTNLFYVLAPIPPGIIAFAMAILSSEARKQRILAFMHPEQWTDSINYQPSQSLIALGSGGLWGKGLGDGICKYGHLPEDTTDFIFAIIGEEMGFVGTACIILLFIVLIVLGFIVIKRCKDYFGQLLATGIILIIGIQAALNIGVVTVVLPTKGIPLPFISSGGTSLLMSAFAISVLLNIAKQTDKNELGDLAQ